MTGSERGIVRTGGSGWLPILCILIASSISPGITFGQEGGRVDFDRTIRRILSENCFKCHGPDARARKGGKHGMRLDTAEGALADLGGYAAIVPDHPEKSELVRRITTADPDDKMPPPLSGKKLKPEEIALLKEWIAQGAKYTPHWAYVKPARPPLPKVSNPAWPKNGIDHFILARLDHEGLKPSPEADRHTLIRRVSLDLTGLPPTPAEVDQFVQDTGPQAFDRLVERLLASSAYGEHWARWWLDQARYADSAGYADDPPRTIWAYRDYVVRSFNENKPFDQFTLEQIAGDLLPHPTEEQLIATGFHRNTQTNNEGGTSDEEFRNVAVVDRVNTTYAVFMATTMGCAQCHDHKYDPITQVDYFRSFAILNNTADADRSDESPVLALFTPEQKKEKREWEADIRQLEKVLQTPTPALAAAQVNWEHDFNKELVWEVLHPDQMESRSGATLTLEEGGAIQVEHGAKKDTYILDIPLTDDRRITALRLEALPDDTLPSHGPGCAKDGSFVVSKLRASLEPPEGTRRLGRFVRIELPGKEKILSLAEVQVFNGGANIARKGVARQSSTAYDGAAALAIDGNTNGNFLEAKSTTHTEISDNPWWEVDLGSEQPVNSIVVWNRTDNHLQGRLKGFRLALLNEKREPVWEQTADSAPNPNAVFSVSGGRPLDFTAAYSDGSPKAADVSAILSHPGVKGEGWSAGAVAGQPHVLTLLSAAPVQVSPGSRLNVTIEQQSKHDYATLGKFRLSVTADPQAAMFAATPAAILGIIKTPCEERTGRQRDELAKYYRSTAPALQPQRDKLASLNRQLATIKPYTTVPTMRELTGDERRKTHIQHRGNYLDLGQEVTEGLPAVFPGLPKGAPMNRLGLARWLVDPDNPLTSRVVANRLWESIFGIGIVRTSEDFGTQGDPPTHPELLDWLATELQQNRWDLKHLLKLMVTSAAYRQSSRDTPELLARDPDNRLLARGPRFRLSAEMIRDQALFASGLLSRKMYGPPVRPPQPKLGLSAAFGGGIDWTTSTGEDRYRRAIYTTWRRSNPYPSMATFDAPDREVCVVRRACSNTPLQALVTLNDPVYVEAAQALARRMASAGHNPTEKAQFGFRLCLARSPSELELKGLLRLYGTTYARMAGDLPKARTVALQVDTTPPPGTDLAELAAWTVVGNVLLNLDEFLMKP